MDAEVNSGNRKAQGRGGGGYSGFQVARMIERGQKSKPKKLRRASNKPKKIPRPNINPEKIPCRISEP